MSLLSEVDSGSKMNERKTETTETKPLQKYNTDVPKVKEKLKQQIQAKA